MTESRGRDHLSISALCSADRCLRKSFYENVIEEAGDADSPPGPKEFGKAIHLAAPTAVVDGVEEAMTLFDSVWTDPPEEDRDGKRNRARAEAMLQSLREQAVSGDIRLVEPPETLKSDDPEVSPYELGFSVDIGLPLPVRGRADGLILDRFGDLRVWEVKTSSEVSSRFLTGLHYHPEVRGYPSLLRHAGLQDVEGTAVTVLRASPSRAETVTELVDVPKGSEAEVLEWMRTVGLRMLSAEKAQRWPKSLSACTSLGSHGHAGWPCDFIELCWETRDWKEAVDGLRWQWKGG